MDQSINTFELFQDIFSYTSSEWSEEVYKRHKGKGRSHALFFYKLLFQQGIGFQRDCADGKISFHGQKIGTPASVSNCLDLWESMQSYVSQNTPLLQIQKIVSDSYTTKILFVTHDGYEIESVVIPMKKKNTLCISSQIGCRMNCQFCETGRMGLLRNLSISEIVQQVYIVRYVLNISIKNIVFMGMGEPFDNYESVIQASRIFMDMQGLGFARKSITISTSGRVREIELFTQDSMNEPMPNLAISLNSANNELRTQLMPYNRKYSLNILLQAITSYIAKTRREVLFAYVLLQGINDQKEHADQVASLLNPIQDHIRLNIIPYNPQSSDIFQPPSDEVIDAFMNHIRSHGIRTFIRITKGRSIMAGCGQLGNLSLRKNRLQNSKNSL